MVSRKMNEIFHAVGALTSGLAQGGVAGMAIGQRQQMIELQRRRENLNDIKMLDDVMKPGVDPAIRKMTLDQIIPNLGLPKEKTDQMMNLATSMDDYSRKMFSEFLNKNPEITSGVVPSKQLLQEFMRDPRAGIKFIQDWNKDQKAEKRADTQLKISEAQLGLQVKGMELEEDRTEASIANDAARTAIAQRGLQMDEERLNIARTEAENKLITDMIENRQKGTTALISAASNPNDKLRGIIARKISDEFNLGLTDEDIAGFEASPESLDTILDKLKIEETTLDIDQKKKGLNLPTATQKSLLAIRARGETTESMPKAYKDYTPEQAQAALDELNTKKVTVTQGSLENKGSRDKARVDIADIEVAQNLNSRLIKIIEENPEASGMLGTAARIGQRLTGAAASFEPLVTGARAEIAQLIVGSDPYTKGQVAKILSNPNVSIAEVLETAVRLRYARILSDSARINKDQYDVAANQIQITGFRDQSMVLTKLKTVNEVFETFKMGKRKLLDSGDIGVMSEDDIQDDTDYGNFLDELEDEEE